MIRYRIASALLGYPDAELRAALPQIRAALDAAQLPAAEHATLSALIAHLAGGNSTHAEETYVQTFDMVPEHSLHLTHHLLGEDRNRGPALIDLAEFYRAHGWEISGKEIPDYLPLMLEFIAQLDTEAGRFFLSRWNKVLRQLGANLAAADSPYAPLIRLLEAHSRLVAASEEIDTPAVATTNPCLDDGDFNAPVDWSAPPPLAGGCPGQSHPLSRTTAPEN